MFQKLTLTSGSILFFFMLHIFLLLHVLIGVRNSITAIENNVSSIIERADFEYAKGIYGYNAKTGLFSYLRIDGNNRLIVNCKEE